MTQDELIKAVAIAMCNATNLPVSADDLFTTADGQTVKRWELMRGQAKAAISLIRGETLEEAARMIDTRWQHGVGDHYAAAIRALKDKQ